MKNEVYITGANGFIGQNLVNFLTGKNYQVHALIRNNTIPKFKLNKNINIYFGDLLDQESLLNSLPKNSIIINLAVNLYHPKLSYKVNVQGTKNLLEAAYFKKVSKFIQVSTLATKIKNKGDYAKSKQQADDLVAEFGLPFVILKPSLVYGLGEEGLFNKLKKILSKNNFIPVFGDGNKKLYPILVEDLCFFIEKIIADQDLTNSTFDLGSEAISYNNFYQKLIDHFNPKAKIIHLPIFLGIILAYIFKFIPNPPFKIDNVLGSTQDINCHCLDLTGRYNYIPLNFEQGLKKILNGQKVKVAVVGLGKMGMFHASILKTFLDVTLVAAVEQNPKLISTIKSMLDTKVYTNLNQALSQNHVDAIFITTPTFTHFDLIKTALKFKIPIFVEKPACLNLAEIHYWENIQNKKNISTGYFLLFNRTFSKLKKIIDSKEYGEIISFEGYCKHSEVLAPKKGWPYQKNKSGGGVLMNPGPHLFSLIYWYFGTPVSQTSSLKSIYSTEVEDEATTYLKYKNFTGKLYLNWSLKNELIPKNYLIIRFQKATVLVDGKKIEITKKVGKKTIYQSDLKPLLEPIFNLNPQSNGESYFIEDRIFIDSVKNDKKSINSLDFAIKTEKIILNSYF